MNFHSASSRLTYATREASTDWQKFATANLFIDGKHCADIGCGGGIYSRALSGLGAETVIGIDSSKEILKGATQKTEDSKVEYKEGDATNIPLEDGSKDLILGRALIHHLEHPEQFFAEAYRVLKPNGFLVVQDRTMEDVMQPATVEHFRGYLFQLYPRLLRYEEQRRPNAKTTFQQLESSGFSSIETFNLWELRRIYNNENELKEDLSNRTGRSILHQLPDSELTQLVELILDKTENHYPLEEKDSWTVWVAKK